MPDKETDNSSASPRLPLQESAEETDNNKDSSATAVGVQGVGLLRRIPSFLVYLGVLAIGALLVFIILNLSGDSNPFTKKLHVKARFSNAYGLQTGSKVLLAGVKVGKVESITFLAPTDVPSAPVVEALMSISVTIDSRPATERVRNDSLA